MGGWIKLYRQIQECWIWEEPDMLKAWIDLLLMANHSKKKRLINGKLVEIDAGQRWTSINHLSERWGWDKRKVKRFLNTLEKDHMISQKCTTYGTMITIENYGVYQNGEPRNGTTDGTTDGTADGTADGTQTRIRRMIKNEENEKNEKNEKKIEYQLIADSYNRICKSFPHLNTLSESRKKAIKARLKTYTIDDIITVFEKAEQSDFLKGGNGKNWNATFDWLMKDSNMAKVLDGNYDNREQHSEEEAKKKAFFEKWGVIQ